MAKIKRDLPIIAFKSQQAWNTWLAAHAASSEGLWLKLAKKSSGIASVSKPEAVDTALCHGWIDGQLDSFDDQYSLVRFTPRRQASKWSERNRTRALELIKLERMLPTGMKEIKRAQKDGRWEAAYAPQSTAEVPEDLRAALKRNAKAARFFETLDRVNRYAILYRIHNAKKPETRAARIEKFVTMLAAGETIHPQKPKSPHSPEGAQRNREAGLGREIPDSAPLHRATPTRARKDGQIRPPHLRPASGPQEHAPLTPFRGSQLICPSR